jgi:co-chaperonin GroES (HSP10)
MTLTPTKDQIVLKKYEPPTQSEGGIMFPQNMTKKPNSDKVAEVVEVGKDVTIVKAGDKVAVNPAYSVAVDFGAQIGTLCFVKEENILAIIDD